MGAPANQSTRLARLAAHAHDVRHKNRGDMTMADTVARLCSASHSLTTQH